MIQEILLFLAGIVLFLFGMMKLSAAVQQLFTARIREYIKYAVTRPVYGLLTGIAATILFRRAKRRLVGLSKASPGPATVPHTL